MCTQHTGPIGTVCLSCESLKRTLESIKVDYEYNIKLLNERDAELDRFEKREERWRHRLKDGCLERERLQNALECVQTGQVTSSNEKLESIQPSTCACKSRTTRDQAVGDSMTPINTCDLANGVNGIEELRVKMRDLESQLESEREKSSKINEKLHLVQVSHRALETSLQETNRHANRVQAQLITKQKHLESAQAINRQMTKECDSLKLHNMTHNQELEQQASARKAMVKELKQLRDKVHQLDTLSVHADLDTSRLVEALERAEQERMELKEFVHTTEAAGEEERARIQHEADQVRTSLMEQVALLDQQVRSGAQLLKLAQKQVKVQAEQLDCARRELETRGNNGRPEFVQKLELQNGEFVDVIRDMRVEMERVISVHDAQMQQVTQKLQEAELGLQNAQTVIQEKDRQMQKTRSELALLNIGKVPINPAPTPLWNPALGQWVLVPINQNHPKLPVKTGQQDSYEIPMNNDTSPNDPYYEQTNLRTQLAEAIAIRERLIFESNRTHAELRRVRSQLHQTVPHAPLLVDTGTQTEFKDGPVLDPQTGYKPADTLVRKPGKPAGRVPVDPKRSALLQLRKLGLRNWNDVH